MSLTTATFTITRGGTTATLTRVFSSSTNFNNNGNNNNFGGGGNSGSSSAASIIEVKLATSLLAVVGAIVGLAAGL